MASSKSTQLAFMLSFMLAGAQPVISQIHAVVADSETKKGIPFVNIYSQYGQQVAGTSSDENGFFHLGFAFEQLSFTHLNYAAISLTKDEIKDTVFLQPIRLILSEVVVTADDKAWIKKLLLEVVDNKRRNYGSDTGAFRYDYKTRSLSDSSGYGFQSRGYLLTPGVFKNKEYLLAPVEGTIKYKDQSAGCDFSGLQKVLYHHDLIHQLDKSTIKNYNFQQVTGDNENRHIVTLYFESRKWDDRGYMAIDSTSKAIVEYRRFSGTEFNLKQQTSLLYRSFASQAMGYKYENLSSETHMTYAKAGRYYHCSDAVLRTALVLSRVNGRQTKTATRSTESQLTLTLAEKPANMQWILLPKPFYIGIEKREDRLAHEALQNIPKKYTDFEIE